MSWDNYFFTICDTLAGNSKCFSRQIGAILVRDKSIISTGYNGPPRGIPPCDRRYEIDKKLREKFISEGFDVENEELFIGRCPRYVLGFQSGEGLEWCVAGHSERNCLINAARNGINTKGTTMYMSCGIPCTPCLIEIINAGVEEIVVTQSNFYDVSAEYLIDKSDLRVRTFNLE